VTDVTDVSWPEHIEQVVRAVAHDTAPFGQVVHAHAVVGSTNDLASQLALEGCPEGTLVLAAAQTRGRGRRGARFVSPPGTGLYASTVLRPAHWPSALRDPEGVPRVITLMAGVAVVEAARALGASHAELKWPNDVIVRTGRGRPWQKLAGILAEASVDTHGLQHVVLGIGMNVSAAPCAAELQGRVTSLSDVAGRIVSLDEAVVALLQRLASAYRKLSLDGTSGIVESWRRHAPAMDGARVTWVDDGRTYSGVTRSIDGTGALRVETSAGTTSIVTADLRWDSDDE
jgi:BirA family biotin operon repressor/biotin-[acetyl-CoA-carboxylase] ligase